jgi:ApaG protein
MSDELVSLQTDGIMVSAGPVLVDEDAENRYMWGYYLCIENNSTKKIRLTGKDWNIADDKGNRYNDSSAGFKGELPELEPGEYFEYTSYAPLKSNNAVFYGSCKVQAEGKDKIVKVPTFSLTARHMAGRILN